MKKTHSPFTTVTSKKNLYTQDSFSPLYTVKSQDMLIPKWRVSVIDPHKSCNIPKYLVDDLIEIQDSHSLRKNSPKRTQGIMQVLKQQQFSKVFVDPKNFELIGKKLESVRSLSPSQFWKESQKKSFGVGLERKKINEDGVNKSGNKRVWMRKRFTKRNCANFGGVMLPALRIEKHLETGNQESCSISLNGWDSSPS